MSLKNTREDWGWLAKVFHWTMAALIVALAAIGTYMANFQDDMIRQIEMTQTHKSFGFVVFVLALLRVLWRWLNPVTPALPDSQTPFQRRAAHGAHILLYALMFVIPVSGWLMASASPFNDVDAYPMQLKNMVFGLFELPDPIQPGNDALTELLHIVHWGSVYLLAAILVVHIGAALKHHYVDRDDILRRMLPGRGQTKR